MLQYIAVCCDIVVCRNRSLASNAAVPVHVVEGRPHPVRKATEAWLLNDVVLHRFTTKPDDRIDARRLDPA